MSGAFGHNQALQKDPLKYKYKNYNNITDFIYFIIST